MDDLGRNAGLRWLGLSAVVIMFDQLTKSMVLAKLTLHERVPLLPFLDWTLAYNKGVAFSLFNQGMAWQRWGLASFAILIASVFVVWLARLPRGDKWSAAALSLVIGGALGNVIDRLRLGHVVDFVLVYWRDWHWPAFNVADSAICIGAALLLFAGIRGERERKAAGA